jgi:nucleoid DNA-binding protein
MSKAELAAKLAEKLKENGDGKLTAIGAKAVIDAMRELIMIELATQGEFVFPGMFKLKTKVKPARKGINPRTSQRIMIAERKVLTIKPRPHVLETLNS